MSLAPQSIAYKESGIPWLGKIPKHWEVLPLQAVFQNRSENNSDKRISLILSLVKDLGIIPYEEKGDIGNKSKDDLSQYKIARENDIVLNKMNAVIGSIGISKYVGLVSPIYLVLAIRNHELFSPLYFSRMFEIKALQESLSQYASGIMKIRESIDYLDFKKMHIPIPPLQEQKTIADFLDKKTQQIEEFITKKQKLITLLEEKKQTLINHCVTQGLDSSISLKDSGVEWLGKIPTHWEIKKLKYISKVVLGKMLCNEKQEGYSHCYYLKSKNLQWLNVDISQVEKMWFSEYEKSIYRVKKDDLLVSEGGEVGKTCIWNDEIEECYIQNSVHKITMDSLNHPRFFLYVFFVYGKKGVFESIVNRVSIAHLVLEKLINIDFAVPPLEEQKTIVEYLDTQIAKIDLAISKIKSQINLIKEYKSTLISEAVCGRVGID